MQTVSSNTTIVGAGLVGSLLGCYLARKGKHVSIYERRGDMRKAGIAGGRSINLAMSNRGWNALKAIGLEEPVRNIAIPMDGRMIHHLNGELLYQPYGKSGQAIYSVSRGLLNVALLNHAEKEFNVEIRFNERCSDIDFENKQITFLHEKSGLQSRVNYDNLWGADGAYSEVRYRMQRSPNFNLSQQHESYGYKELSIPANPDGSHRMEKNALHIWPRESFMMIALPNTDGTFTCTIFAPYEGENGFSNITDSSSLLSYFERNFPDAIPLITGLESEFFSNPTGSLVTVKCFPWHYNDACLIGDAAHAIVPFYGQGMNCGFEDVAVLEQLMDHYEGTDLLQQFQAARKENADAIAHLALYNFIEMRDLAGREDFQLRLKIEKRIAEHFPEKFATLYSMVTFSDKPYSYALKRGEKQAELLDRIMRLERVAERWEGNDILEIANEWIQNNA